MAMTLPPVNQRRIRAVAAAMDAGLITDAEAQRLLGFLMMRGRSSSPRTARRRVAKLRELDLLEVTPEESAAVEFGQLVEAGELSAEEAELRAGRWFLAHVAVKEARERTGDGRAPRSIA
jgi:hypothetical protein